MKKSLISCFIFTLLCLLSQLAYASSGIGEVADNLLVPVEVLNSFIYTTCFIIGGAFLFATVIKYIEHRRSPLLVPISTVIFLLIAGIVLILLPLIPLVTN